MGRIKSFKDLELWKKGIELVREVYKLTEKFPAHELYGLVSQMRRSAVSIPSNVAEGFRRRHSKEFKQFLNMTMGSLAELETQLIIANDLSYLKKEDQECVSELIDHVSRMAANLLKKL
ncbi:MAG: four helix bundle protein [Candidatus Omnitrophica bacterium]|nr:four helix bundle protein [Candidatus Omnitrophota bacterium]